MGLGITSKIVISILVALLVLISIAALALIFGGPSKPPPMKSIVQPFQTTESFKHTNHSFMARDGQKLAYRLFPANSGKPKGSVVLLHGSGASSRSMQALATTFATADYTAYALDVRGHGASAMKGDIAYVGQLEDDLEDFIQKTEPTTPTTLVGFSSGGGFALRVAGSKRQQLFNHYLLLSPFISQEAPTQKPDSGGWVNIGLPRYITILMLNQLDIDLFNHLTVTRFALPDNVPDFLTPAYSFNLARNYRPKPDYQTTIQSVSAPMNILAGRDDEAFQTENLDDVFNHAQENIPVTLLPGINHAGLILEPKAMNTAVEIVNKMNAGNS